MLTVSTRPLLCALATLTLAISGCGGGSTVSVDGVVTFDGKPVDRATVTFRPASGRVSIGVTDSSGRYALQYTGTETGASPGNYKVTITTAIEGSSGEGDVAGVAGREELLPAKYHSESELTATVESSSTTVNFDLTSE